MNLAKRLDNLEKQVSFVYKPVEHIWVCICGEDPCICTEEHKLKHNLGVECKGCKWSEYPQFKSQGRWVFWRGNECIGIPIVDRENLPELLELARSGNINIPIPLLGGLSAR